MTRDSTTSSIGARLVIMGCALAANYDFSAIGDTPKTLFAAAFAALATLATP